MHGDPAWALAVRTQRQLGIVVPGFVLLGILRLLQTEFDSWATTGPWSWTAYLIVFAISSILLYLTIKRIQQDNLSKEPK